MTTQTSHLTYLEEFRIRIIRICVSFAVTFLLLFYWGRVLFEQIADPILDRLPSHMGIISTQITTSFTAPMRLCFFLSALLILPLIFIEFWLFLKPALFRHEKKIIFPLCLLSIFLFYSGAGFAFFVVIPAALSFFINFLPPSVAMMADMEHYLNFILSLTIAFGLSFQVPILICLVTHLGLIEVDTLKRSRRFAIVIAFILGMILTPPDVISQIMLALPLWGLYEIGILLAVKPNTSQSNEKLP